MPATTTTIITTNESDKPQSIGVSSKASPGEQRTEQTLKTENTVAPTLRTKNVEKSSTVLSKNTNKTSPKQEIFRVIIANEDDMESDTPPLPPQEFSRLKNRKSAKSSVTKRKPDSVVIHDSQELTSLTDAPSSFKDSKKSKRTEKRHKKRENYLSHGPIVPTDTNGAVNSGLQPQLSAEVPPPHSTEDPHPHHAEQLRHTNDTTAVPTLKTDPRSFAEILGSWQNVVATLVCGMLVLLLVSVLLKE